MRKSVVSTGIFCLAVGVLTAGSWAQSPIMKIWVTEVYEVNPDGSYTEKCASLPTPLCPTQDLGAGIAQAGDLLNIEVHLEGWDIDTDTGVCSRTLGTANNVVCSVSAQDCTDFFCTGTDGPCVDDDDCFAGQTCEIDACNKTPLLGAFQWGPDCDTYSNGGAPGLAPAVLGCNSNADCACGYTSIAGAQNDCSDFAEFGFCTCSASVCGDDNTCSPDATAYLDKSGPRNYVFAGHSTLDIIATDSCDVALAALSTDSVIGGVPEELFRCSAGNQPQCNVDADCAESGGNCELRRSGPYYIGTLLLQATDNACGLFAVDLDGSEESTFLRDSLTGRLPNPVVEALMVNFGDAFACDDGDPCTVDDQFCDGAPCAGTPIVCDEGETCVNGVCRPEVGDCDFTDLVSAYWSDDSGLATDPFDRPGDCAIDARQPHVIDDAGATGGWDRLVLEFTCDPTAFAGGLTPADFSITTVPSSQPPFLLRSGIIPNAGDKTLTLKPTRSFSPGFYTCIANVASSNQWCAGYLPADTNQGSVSDASDIGALIDSINGPAQPVYATDIDRSGATNAQDVLRLIDLLNGAGQFEVWLAASLEACPSAP